MSSKVFLSEKKSSWENIKLTWQELHKLRLFLALLCVLFLLNACSSKKVAVVVPKKASIGSVQLTEQEKRIFYTTGDLDRNLPDSAIPMVAKEYHRFLYGSRDTMQRFATRSEDYLGHVRKTFRKHGIPEEMAYLGLVESGYHPTVKSHAGAAGMWQFMPFTGKQFGLHQDRYIDERLDPYEAVEAAAQYLNLLHNMFGDWLLALAAYNAGQGKIKRALEGTGAKDYFTLLKRNHLLSHKAQLRTETILYVPRFLAMSKIMRNLQALGFTPVNHNQDALHSRITVSPNTDLRLIAKEVDLPYHEFKKINAHHKTSKTHRRKNTYIYVPKYSHSSVTSYLARKKHSPTYYGKKNVNNKNVVAAKQASAPSKGTFYIVKKGDSLSGISAKYGISLTTLKRANNIHNSSKLQAGKRLIIPIGTSKLVAKSKRTHVVKRGDTVSAIAQKYNMSTKQLLQLNRKNSSNIRTGEKLLVSSL